MARGESCRAMTNSPARITTPITAAIRLMLICAPWTSEPPTKADIERVPRLHDVALIAQLHEVGLYRDVGVGIVRQAEDPGVAIELLQRDESIRHSMLRVEVLVADKRDQVPR